MTVIVGLVGKDGCLIAGDSQWSTPYQKRNDTQSKVWTFGETVAFGACGSGRFGQILEYHLETLREPPLQMDELEWVIREFIPLLREATEQHGHLHVYHNVEEFGPSEFLMAVRGRLFCVYADFSVAEHVHPYEVTGSGGETAVGVLHAASWSTRGEMLKVARKAVAAATDLTPFVGGDVTHVETTRWTADEKALARRILGGKR